MNATTTTSSRPRLPTKLVLLAAALTAAVGFLIWTGTQGATVYYHTVGEVRDMGSDAYYRLIRVNGIVADGSIQSATGSNLISFDLQDDSGRLPVEYRGTPPDLFGYSSEDRYQEVIVEGQLEPNGAFRARSLIVKHGPEFEPREIPSQ
ncbi:MAG: cytochrome c maturation protein CcmE [Chloroflexota bacterium]|nr:cytochrome c maturation protein CcmE [Chloroflexota bacterium]MDE2920632.1 cytochrome c maturation protein CcmE [Chloroflexota bacterium]